MRQTICSVGDTIFHDGFPAGYDLNPIRNVAARADVKLFNLENVVSDRDIFGSSYCGGMWLLGREDTLDDTLRFGFNGCSFANNHTMDFAYDGLFDTLKAVEKKGIALADSEECRVVYAYLCDRNEQFGTQIILNDRVIEVKMND